MTGQNNINNLLIDEIKGKNAAVHAYNKILWAIRSGVLSTILLGWSYFLKGMIDQKQSMQPYDLVILILSILTLITVLVAWAIDVNFLRRKYRVVKTYNSLCEWLIVNNYSEINVEKFNQGQKKELVKYLQISGDDKSKSYKGQAYNNARRVSSLLYGIITILTTLIIPSLLLSHFFFGSKTLNKMETFKNNQNKFSINLTEKNKIDKDSFFRISDNTLVYPFFNSKDETSGLPFDLCDEFSVSSGIIEAGTISKIHAHPHITQMTFVLSGNIEMKVKELNKPQYEIQLSKYQATLSPKGSIIQFDNSRNDKDCHVLYIVGPPYLYLTEQDGKKVIYEDAIILEESWDELQAKEWRLETDFPTAKKRSQAFGKLKSLSK